MENQTYYLTVLVVCVVLFFLLRYVNLWYWKINNIIDNQERTNKLLGQLVELMGGETQSEVEEPVEEPDEPVKEVKIKVNERSTEDLTEILSNYEQDKSLYHSHFINLVKNELKNRS